MPWSVDMNSVDLRNCNKAALHLATIRGHQDIVNTLLKHGAEVNLLDESGFPPINYAVLRGHISILKLLLENGASCDFPGDQMRDSRLARWMSPLHCLSITGGPSTWEPIFSLLLQHGADLNVQHADIDTPLNYVTRDRRFTVTAPFIRLLLENGADCNLPGTWDMTPLHNTVHDESISRLLLEHGADVHAVTDTGNTPLHLSASMDHEDGMKVLKLLLAYGADVNARDDTGDTPLHLSALEYTDSTKVLLEHGADVHARNNEGHTPLRIAVGDKILHNIRLLLDHGADATIVDDDTGNNLLNVVGLSLKDDEVNLGIMTMLLDHGPDVNHANYEGMTPLLYATSPEDMPADFDEELHERKDIVKLLLDRGADVNGKTKEGITALHLTLTNGLYGFVRGFVEMFIEHGIDVNAELVDGRTPLDMVEDEGTRIMLAHEIGLLRQHGARNGVPAGARQMPPECQPS